MNPELQKSLDQVSKYYRVTARKYGPPDIPVSVIAIQCCVQQVCKNRPPDIIYEDTGILSDKNKVKIWRSSND